MGNQKIYATSLSLDQAGKAWFIFEDMAQSIACCTALEFQAFIASLDTSRWHDEVAKSLLQERVLDLLDRWCILSSLQEDRVIFKLYSSREQAKNALQCNSEVVATSVPLLPVKPRVRHYRAKKESNLLN